MSRKVTLFISLSFLLCLSSSVFGQDKPKLITDVEQIFREQEPAWKVERIYGNTTSDPYSQSIVFRTGKVQASLEISIWKRLIDAKEVFAATSLVMDRTMGKGKLKRTVPKLGDESYMWTDRNGAGWTTLKFREQSINVEVFAPSPMTAKRFAQRIFKQIAISKQDKTSESAQ